MSVAVQLMVDARVAGVMFTLNPVSGDPSWVAIDASYGLGYTVVGGDVTPDSFLVSKVTREVVRSAIGEKAIECVADVERPAATVDPRGRRRPPRDGCASSRHELQARSSSSRASVERHYGRAQDLEWAIDRRLGEVFLSAEPRRDRLEPEARRHATVVAARPALGDRRDLPGQPREARSNERRARS